MKNERKLIMDNRKIGNLITAQRKKKGLNQRQLAERLNVTDKAVSRWETGKGMPETSLLQPLAEELEITVSELLCGELHEAERRSDEADKIIINTLNISKKKTRLATILLIIIALMITGFGIVYHYQSQEMISNLKTISYDIRGEEGSGCIGTTFSFDKSAKVDGYEFMCYFKYGNGVQIVDSYEAYSADKTSYYVSGQDGPSKIRIRAYDEQANGERLYTEWMTVLDTQDEKSIDYDNLDTITSSEWEALTTGSTCFDPYNYK